MAIAAVAAAVTPELRMMVRGPLLLLLLLTLLLLVLQLQQQQQQLLLLLLLLHSQGAKLPVEDAHVATSCAAPPWCRHEREEGNGASTGKGRLLEDVLG